LAAKTASEIAEGLGAVVRMEGAGMRGAVDEDGAEEGGADEEDGGETAGGVPTGALVTALLSNPADVSRALESCENSPTL
jgi:hypothetical protein